MRLALPAFVAYLAVGLSGCGHISGGYPPRPISNPSEVMDFTTLYNQNCAACHGRNGQNGPAIDLGNPEYQALADDDVLNSWISGGIPGTEMPAFAKSSGGMLSNEQIEALIAGMRKQWARPNAFGGATPPPYEQPENADAQRGADAYRARCAGCHAASPLQITSQNYLALMADQQLRSVIIAGRPDIGQPDWRLMPVPEPASNGQPILNDKLIPPMHPQPLSAQEVDNIVAYLGSLRNPQGPTATIRKPGAGR